MHVPKGKIVHENLSTSYVSLSPLLDELQANKFTGYVLVCFGNYEGYVFIDNGQFINAYEKDEGIEKIGRAAIEGILSRSQVRGGTVSFFQHPNSVIQALAGIIDGEPVYRELTSEFTNIERLVEKLKKSSNETWYIEVVLQDDVGAGVVYIADGNAEAVASIRVIPEAFEDSSLETTSGEEGLLVLFEKVNYYGGTFNVYKVAKDLVARNIKHSFVVDEGHAKFDSNNDIQASVANDVSSSGVVVNEDKQLSVTDESNKYLIDLIGDVIVAIERSTSEVVRESDFKVALREALLRAAENYPFLDPFAREFEYTSGSVVFVGMANPNDFINGVSQALHLAIDYMSKKFPEAKLKKRIEIVLDDLLDRRQLEFEPFGVGRTLREVII